MTAIADILWGSVDLHVHSGPSPFPRRFTHAEAARDAGERLGMRGILCKSHHHNTVMDLLSMKDQLAGLSCRAFGGIAMNNQVGGVNPFAVEMSLRMGGKAVWLPTFSSGRHIDCHPEGTGFPTATVELRNVEVSIRREDGRLLDELHDVLGLVAESSALLSGGHMDPDSIEEVFTEAKARGIRRLVVSHPNFVIGAEPEQARRIVELGSYMEHEVSMYDPKGTKQWDPQILKDWIDAIGPEHTVLASDLGQANRELPVDAFLRVGEILLDLGVEEKDLQRMTRDNPAFLLGLED
ncbi:DUF6282 family protein [Pseudonocardia sp. MH-G8]|uniref:DUF6282 family protein n=1 Tax=Pseudonocardia sp. MH-G8 TaxID=1854588 RepID=UPI000B9FEE5E|nr:DUF6282 family protein [Pseudonocardia sp. MH-G8]OZM75815.1 hypothetical protein CFP66_44535 [Pseudonocardia sp. MH-G8]